MTDVCERLAVPVESEHNGFGDALLTIALTGAVEVGKSTVLHRLIRAMRKNAMPMGGVITLSDARGWKWVMNVGTGRRRLLADDHHAGTLIMGRYHFRDQAFEFANHAIESTPDHHCLVIDEMGILELEGRGFTSALPVLKSQRHQRRLLVLRQRRLEAYREVLGPIDKVFTVTEHNRHCLHQDIFKHLITH